MGVGRMCSNRKGLSFCLRDHPSQCAFDDWCGLVSVFFYIPQNIIFHLRGQSTEHRPSSQIAEAPLGLNFMREFPESQNLILKLAIDVVLVSGYLSGFMSWPICAMNESLDHLPSSPSLNYLKQWTGSADGLSIGQLHNLPLPPRKLDVDSE